MAICRIRLKLLVFVCILFVLFTSFKIYFAGFSPTHSFSIKDQVDYLSPEDERVYHNVADKKIYSYSNEYSQALEINFQQKLYNTEQFGQHTSNSIIIAVQYDENLDHLKVFLSSLKQVKDIEKVTVVLSTSDNSNETHNIISQIAFCRYMHIVFPFSMNFFSDSFPGEDPNDCPRNIAKHEAIAKNCNNAHFPDIYGHYREVKFVQTKHHWLWKCSMLSNGIKMFKEQQAAIILLEGSDYVLPDLLHCTEKALSLKVEKCPNCAFVNLGNNLQVQDFTVSNHVEIFPWISTKSAFGLVVTSNALTNIFHGIDVMCEFDDYNWAWSLHHLLSSKLTDSSLTLQFKTTRVYHLGSCLGMPKSNCVLEEEVKFIESIFNNEPLFPDDLYVVSQSSGKSSGIRPNGGWGDIRDQTLCKNYKYLIQQYV